ncbi:hypothetical protein DSM19430T_29020 [Desulfovibrio psychrotolerans]|uniref:Uncharacterized protein n=1 Tax=Desulfovibrio psychrotolerans TaxID=415242 RepID=A0A7J0BWZ1_9BACT|nr:hypothetical protein DSM19430T_29020 [Desulfovibrio psychrotolerans]
MAATDWRVGVLMVVMVAREVTHHLLRLYLAMPRAGPPHEAGAGYGCAEAVEQSVQRAEAA